MTATIVDDLTDTASDKNRECTGQGVANIATGFFGGMAGCAMIGQSVINVKSGGRGRLSTLSAGRVPAVPDRVPRRLGGADPDGGAGRGDDHGLDRHLQLGVDAQPADASRRAPVDRDARDRGGGGRHARPGHTACSSACCCRALLRQQGRRSCKCVSSELSARTAARRTYRVVGQVFFASADNVRRRLRLQGGRRHGGDRRAARRISGTSPRSRRSTRWC